MGKDGRSSVVTAAVAAQFTRAIRQWGPPAIMILAATAVLAALTAAPPADAAANQARHMPPTEATSPRSAGEPIMAIVSIKSQQVTLHDADGRIMRAPVSTGTTGRETPAGVFSVVGKDKDHHSSLYDDAWMPNMLRITWSGIALHGGPLPGYAASHGCVRMPYDFAETLFDKARIGMRVIIAPSDVEPVEFSHPALFMPNPEALAAVPMRAETLTRGAAEAAKLADKAKTTAALAAPDAKSLTALLHKLTELTHEPVSVFISRATQRLYVRRGFEAILEVPITIRNSDRPIGTHIFTAVARTETGLRWTAITIESGDDAKDALDRITIPQDVLDRIASIALPRSSLIVSDEPPNRETNYRTEFVVVLNNQPQGGLAMRRRPESARVARRNVLGEDGLGSNSSPAWDSQYGYTGQRGGRSNFQGQQSWSGSSSY
jgi:lipoprotein-anchoring transpeptidase ErfK/SrfK